MLLELCKLNLTHILAITSTYVDISTNYLNDKYSGIILVCKHISWTFKIFKHIFLS